MQLDKDTGTLLVTRDELGFMLRGDKKGDISDLDFKIDDFAEIPDDIDIYDLIDNENTVTGFMEEYLGLDPEHDSLTMRDFHTIEFDVLGVRGLIDVVECHLTQDQAKRDFRVGTPMGARTKKEIERIYDKLIAIYDEQVDDGVWPKIND